MRQIIWTKQRGMTLTELLAVLLILSLLATIAVPVYTARQEDARIRVAQAECRELGTAEEQVAVIHGFYVPLQVLDDTPVSSNGLLAPPPTNGGNSDINEQIDFDARDNLNLLVINANVPAYVQTQGAAIQARLSDGLSNVPPTGNVPGITRVRNMILYWEGPFLTFHRYWSRPNAAYQVGDPQYYTSGDVFRDYPLDPWGNPYRLYSPMGVVGSVDENAFDPVNPDDHWSDGNLTGSRSAEQRFSRYAVVSYGRDSMSDKDPTNTTNYRDDIVYEFGTDGLNANFARF